MTNKIKENLRFNAILAVIPGLILYWLIFHQSYSGGYGKLVDGELDTEHRISLWSSMAMDYARDGGEWSFGKLVPFAVLGLLWFKRKEVFGVESKPSNILGLAVLLFGFLLYWMGYLGHQKYVGYASGQIIVLGLIFWFGGWKVFKRVYWLWFLLGMMWPWRFLIGKISAPLQLLMAKLTAGFLNLVGAGATQNGSAVISSQRDMVDNAPISLDVSVACSGMRSLFALIMIGLIVALVTVKSDKKRWIFMACVPVLAIMGNFVRMLMLYFGNLFFGAKFAIGEGELDPSAYHIIAGLVVFVVAIFLMMGVSDILNNGLSRFGSSKKKVVVKSQ